MERGACAVHFGLRQIVIVDAIRGSQNDTWPHLGMNRQKLFAFPQVHLVNRESIGLRSKVAFWIYGPDRAGDYVVIDLIRTLRIEDR